MEKDQKTKRLKGQKPELSMIETFAAIKLFNNTKTSLMLCTAVTEGCFIGMAINIFAQLNINSCILMLTRLGIQITIF